MTRRRHFRQPDEAPSASPDKVDNLPPALMDKIRRLHGRTPLPRYLQDPNINWIPWKPPGPVDIPAQKMAELLLKKGKEKTAQPVIDVSPKTLESPENFVRQPILEEAIL